MPRLVPLAVLALALAAPAAAGAAFSSDQQKCVNTFNKELRKIVKTVGKDYGACLKDRAKSTDTNDKLAGLTVPQCFDADRKGKQAGAISKAGDKFTGACAGGDNPGVAVTDPATAAAAAIAKEKELFAVMFGEDVQAEVLREVDDKNGSQCQQAITKAMGKCQDTKINEFIKCKKDAMKLGKEPFLGGAMSVEQIAGCINLAWVVDEKQKVAKKCDLDDLGKVDGIRKTIQKKCVDKTVDLSDAFPGCDTDDAAALHACLETRLECATCLAMRAADDFRGASLNCDIIDNGAPDDSCTLLAVETVDIPSTAEPAETPGTSGVVVTHPDLITQFGGPGFSLNNARYTRWRARGPEQTPDAVLVLIPGFGGGSNNFKLLAEDFIPMMLADHGLVVEVWGFSRRTNQLEDRAGVFIAQALNSPLVALDWYYGDDMGLTLHPALVAGPNRRAFFYNTSSDIPFIANFNVQTHSLDVDAVVEAARAVVSNDNVFLGGHSFGTTFTARYAATDLDLGGGGPPDPGYAKVRGLVMLEGGAGSTGQPLSSDTLDRIEAKFDGGLFGAVRDASPRCVDGTTPCSIANEAVDCVGQVPPKCTRSEPAYAALPGLSVSVLAASEPGAIQGATDPDGGQVILQVDQTGPDTSAIDLVPELGVLGIFGPSTTQALLGAFLDDDGLVATLLNPAIATSLGEPGGMVLGLQTWRDYIQGGFGASVLPDNGPAPTTLPGGNWGQEREVTRIDRYSTQFLHASSNAADWYFGTAGLGMTSVTGVCDTGGTNLCTVGDVGAPCASNADCSQGISIDSTALSVGRARRDIVNMTQAGSIDVPVISFGGSNGLVPVAGRMTAFGQSIATCTAPSCDGTARVVDALNPNPAFPTFGDVDGGFEVHVIEGYAHQDVVTAEANEVLAPLGAFIARNVQ